MESASSSPPNGGSSESPASTLPWSRRRADRLPAIHVNPDGNERLTAATGAFLLVLLAAEGVTILFLRPLLSMHVFVGMLLIPPVALKLGSTVWRFARYYTGRAEYVEKGAPLLPLRMLAPLLVASTVAVLATGVGLLVRGPGQGLLVGLHKASFVVWLLVFAIHVLVYVWRVPRIALPDWRRRAGGASFARRTALAGAVVAGAVLAITTISYTHPWVHWMATVHHHDD